MYALLPSLWPDGVDAQTLQTWSEEQLNKFRHVQARTQGESVVVVHLQSERGRQLNGQRGKLVGGDPPGSPADEWRLHVWRRAFVERRRTSGIDRTHGLDLLCGACGGHLLGRGKR